MNDREQRRDNPIQMYTSSSYDSYPERSGGDTISFSSDRSHGSATTDNVSYKGQRLMFRKTVLKWDMVPALRFKKNLILKRKFFFFLQKISANAELYPIAQLGP